ncbi:MAG: hypothetical protein ACRDNE_16555, partial [Gaiellaceae bacterium]
MLRRFQLTENAALSPEERRAPGTVPAGRATGGGGESDEQGRLSREALLFATAATQDGGPAAVLGVVGTTVLGRLLS